MYKKIIYSLTISFSFLLLISSTFNVTFAYLESNEVFNNVYAITNNGESFIILCSVTLALLISIIIIYIKEQAI